MFKWCWHNWSKWETHRVVKVNTKTTVEYEVLVQIRVCSKCGKLIERDLYEI